MNQTQTAASGGLKSSFDCASLDQKLFMIHDGGAASRQYHGGADDSETEPSSGSMLVPTSL